MKIDATEHVTHLASKNRIRPRTCYAILHEIEHRGIFKSHRAWRTTGIATLFGFRERVDRVREKQSVTANVIAITLSVLK